MNRRRSLWAARVTAGLLLVTVGATIVAHFLAPCALRDAYYWLNRTFWDELLTNLTGKYTRAVRDVTDPGEILDSVSGMLSFASEAGMLPTDQDHYDGLEKKLVTTPLFLTKNRQSHYRRRYSCATNYYLVTVDVGYGLPYLYIDKSHPKPTFAFPDSNSMVRAQARLLSDLVRMRVCSLTRFWDVATPLCLLQYFPSSPRSVEFLQQRASDSSELRKVQLLAQNTLVGLTSTPSIGVANSQPASP